MNTIAYTAAHYMRVCEQQHYSALKASVVTLFGGSPYKEYEFASFRSAVTVTAVACYLLTFRFNTTDAMHNQKQSAL